jgi:hypothetical protein
MEPNRYPFALAAPLAEAVPAEPATFPYSIADRRQSAAGTSGDRPTLARRGVGAELSQFARPKRFRGPRKPNFRTFQTVWDPNYPGRSDFVPPVVATFATF